MFERDAAEPLGTSEERADRALREGLLTLAVPPVAPHFDAQVLAAVRDARPLRERLAEALRFRNLRPVLVGAACGLALTFGAYAWVARLPVLEVRPVVKRAAGVGPKSDTPRKPEVPSRSGQGGKP